MAEQFTLTDGTTSVNLINTGATGIQPLVRRATRHVLDPSMFDPTPGDLEAMIFVETWSLKLTGSSHDNVASQQQTLVRLLRQAWRYHVSPTQYRPVYITAQSNNETNQRHALVYKSPEVSGPDFLEYQFRQNDLWFPTNMTIQRFPWQSGVPGVLPSAATLNPMWVQEAMALRDGTQEFNSVTTAGSGAFASSGGDDVAKGGLMGYKVTVGAAADTAYGGLTEPNNDKGILFEFDFYFDTADLTMASGDAFIIAGTNISNILVRFTNTAGVYSLRGMYRTDGAAWPATANYTITEGEWHRVRIVWTASTAVGADDGELHFHIDGVLKESLTGADNDTRTITTVLFGAHSEVDAGTSGFFYIDNCRWARWDDSAPTLMPVSNYHDDIDVKYVYNYDDSAAAFSANLAGTRKHALWSVSGSTPDGNDILYIGSDFDGQRAMHVLYFDIATASVTTGTLRLDYYNGSWTTLTYGTDYWIYPKDDEDELFKSTGSWAIFIQTPSDMASVAINGVTTGWFRLYVVTPGTWTTTPVTSDIPIFAARNPYIELPETTFNGDIPPLLAMRVYTPAGATEVEGPGNISRILVGAKRGGEGFVSHLPMADVEAVHPVWTAAAGTDAAEAEDDRAPRGARLDVSFATDATMVSRLRFTGTHQLRPFTGEYRAFLRLAQIGGTAGDINVKLRVRLFSTNAYAPSFDTPSVGTGLTDTYWEVVDLGKVKIPFGDLSGPEALNIATRRGYLYFEVHAERTTGAATLRLADLILIPVDQWAAEFDDPVSDSVNGTSALRGLSALQTDGGILHYGTNKLERLSGVSALWHVAENWGHGGPPITLEPAQDWRLYFLFMHYPTTFGTPPFASSLGQGGMVEIYGLERWLGLRGAD